MLQAHVAPREMCCQARRSHPRLVECSENINRITRGNFACAPRSGSPCLTVFRMDRLDLAMAIYDVGPRQPMEAVDELYYQAKAGAYSSARNSVRKCIMNVKTEILTSPLRT